MCWRILIQMVFVLCLGASFQPGLLACLDQMFEASLAIENSKNAPWNNARIIAAVKEIHNKLGPEALTPANMQKHKNAERDAIIRRVTGRNSSSNALYQQARTRFANEETKNGWPLLLQAAGIDPGRANQGGVRWSSDLVIQGVRAIYSRYGGERLSSRAMVAETRGSERAFLRMTLGAETSTLALYNAAREAFRTDDPQASSWQAALKAAGVPLDEVLAPPPGRLSNDQIIEALRFLHERNSFVKTRSSVPLNPGSLHIDRSRTSRRVILRATGVENVNGSQLYDMAELQFEGGYRQALAEAGVELEGLRARKVELTMEDIKKLITELASRGQSLRAIDFENNRDQVNLDLVAGITGKAGTHFHTVYMMVREHYGAWYAGLDAMGIDSRQYSPMTWNTRRIFQALTSSYFARERNLDVDEVLREEMGHPRASWQGLVDAVAHRQGRGVSSEEVQEYARIIVSRQPMPSEEKLDEVLQALDAAGYQINENLLHTNDLEITFALNRIAEPILGFPVVPQQIRRAIFKFGNYTGSLQRAGLNVFHHSGQVAQNARELELNSQPDWLDGMRNEESEKLREYARILLNRRPIVSVDDLHRVLRALDEEGYRINRPNLRDTSLENILLVNRIAERVLGHPITPIQLKSAMGRNGGLIASLQGAGLNSLEHRAVMPAHARASALATQYERFEDNDGNLTGGHLVGRAETRPEENMERIERESSVAAAVAGLSSSQRAMAEEIMSFIATYEGLFTNEILASHLSETLGREVSASEVEELFDLLAAQIPESLVD